MSAPLWNFGGGGLPSLGQNNAQRNDLAWDAWDRYGKGQGFNQFMLGWNNAMNNPGSAWPSPSPQLASSLGMTRPWAGGRDSQAGSGAYYNNARNNLNTFRNAFQNNQVGASDFGRMRAASMQGNPWEFGGRGPAASMAPTSWAAPMAGNPGAMGYPQGSSDWINNRRSNLNSFRNAFQNNQVGASGFGGMRANTIQGTPWSPSFI